MVFVSSCRDTTYCKFGPSKCWFTHGYLQENKQLESSEIMGKNWRKIDNIQKIQKQRFRIFLRIYKQNNKFI